MHGPVRGKPDLAPAPTPREGRNFVLDKDLRGFLKTNEDVVLVITKPVSIKNIGAIAAQSAPGMAVDDVWGTPSSPDVDSDELELDEPEPEPAPAPPAAPPPSGTGIDMSQIRFHRKSAAATEDETGTSGTFHSINPHSREPVAQVGTGGWKKVEVGVGHAEEVTSADEPGPAGGGAGLDSLFDGMGMCGLCTISILFQSPTPGRWAQGP